MRIKRFWMHATNVWLLYQLFELQKRVVCNGKRRRRRDKQKRKRGEGEEAIRGAEANVGAVPVASGQRGKGGASNVLLDENLWRVDEAANGRPEERQSEALAPPQRAAEVPPTDTRVEFRERKSYSVCVRGVRHAVGVIVIVLTARFGVARPFEPANVCPCVLSILVLSL